MTRNCINDIELRKLEFNLLLYQTGFGQFPLGNDIDMKVIEDV